MLILVYEGYVHTLTDNHTDPKLRYDPAALQ